MRLSAIALAALPLFLLLVGWSGSRAALRPAVAVARSRPAQRRRVLRTDCGGEALVSAALPLRVGVVTASDDGASWQLHALRRLMGAAVGTSSVRLPLESQSRWSLQP